MEAMEVQNNLAMLRAKRGLGAAQLAATVGVSRQTIYAIEAGTYVPNTAVSLKLAHALDVKVEEIFQIELEAECRTTLLMPSCSATSISMAPGQPLRLCGVGNHVVAVAPEAGSSGTRSSPTQFFFPLSVAPSCTPTRKSEFLAMSGRSQIEFSSPAVIQAFRFSLMPCRNRDSS